MSTNWSPDRQAEVGDHVAQPSIVKVAALDPRRDPEVFFFQVVFSSAAKRVCVVFFWGGPAIDDLGPLPGPTRPRGLGKAPAGASLDLHRSSARENHL